MEERGKFQNETLSNVDSIKRAGGVAAETAAGVTNEYIVVTLLVACDGLLRVRLSRLSRSSLARARWLDVPSLCVWPTCLGSTPDVPAWLARERLMTN
jgi:uncharacterized membrane protein